MSHPHEFGFGTVSLNDLTEMIDLLEADGWSSATFHSSASDYLVDHPSASPIEASGAASDFPSYLPSLTPVELEPGSTNAPILSTTSASSLSPPTASNVDQCCPPGYSGVYGDDGCLSYHQCVNGVPVGAPIFCPAGQVLDSEQKYCNWAYFNPPCDVSC